ncbi:hypothetical protein AB9P05_19745 [Roseivirga sp. BDSF3-8]|uniref:GldL-related protein n=1 Tax=Roseivirga sp. BDSF3-8 TaxID=3241598 RepID=UPI0035326E77
MKTTEQLLAALFSIGLLLKALHLQGANMVTALSLTALSCLYFYLGFALFNGIRLRRLFKRDSYTMSTWRIIGSVGAGMALSMVVTGILFKVMHWEGSNVMLTSGLLPLA